MAELADRSRALLALPDHFPAGCPLVFYDHNHAEVGRSVSVDPQGMTVRSAPCKFTGSVYFMRVLHPEDGSTWVEIEVTTSPVSSVGEHRSTDAC
jgi:hypothetical protein